MEAVIILRMLFEKIACAQFAGIVFSRLLLRLLSPDCDLDPAPRAVRNAHWAVQFQGGVGILAPPQVCQRYEIHLV